MWFRLNKNTVKSKNIMNFLRLVKPFLSTCDISAFDKADAHTGFCLLVKM